MRILIAEDNELIARGLRRGLRSHGLTADSVDTAAAAEHALQLGHFDVLLLDLGLPDEDGLDLLRRLRADGFTRPVLLLTARDAVSDRIRGLQAGADDYLTKPFDLGELVARLHALQRRSGGRAQDSIECGKLRLEPSSGKVWLEGEPVELSRREISLLGALMDANGRCLSGEQLEDALYGFDEPIGSNAINVHIHNLRRKLGSSAIVTVRGIGYRLGGKCA